MVGGRPLEARTHRITAVVPSSLLAQHELFESGYNSANSPSDDSSKQQQVRTARSRKHRQKTPASTISIQRSKSAFNSTRQRNRIEDLGRKHQQIQKLNRDQLKSARISIDVSPVHQVIELSFHFHQIFYI